MDTVDVKDVQPKKTRNAGPKSRTVPSREAVEAVHATREDDEVMLSFEPSGALKAPPPRQGKVQRWIRASIGNVSDPSNYQKKTYRYGWSPRPASTVPEESRWFTEEQRVEGIIRVGGMVLCERPIEIEKSHREYIDKQTAGQRARVDHELRTSAFVEKGMRPFVQENKTQTILGDSSDI